MVKSREIWFFLEGSKFGWRGWGCNNSPFKETGLGFMSLHRSKCYHLHLWRARCREQGVPPSGPSLLVALKYGDYHNVCISTAYYSSPSAVHVAYDRRAAHQTPSEAACLKSVWVAVRAARAPRPLRPITGERGETWWAGRGEWE